MIRNVLLGNVILAVQYAVGGLVPVLLIPHLVHTIGLSAFGDLAVALACANYGAIVVQYAFQYTGPRRMSQLKSGETARGVFADIANAKALLLLPALAAMTVAAALLPAGPNASAQWALMAAVPIGAALNSGWHLQTAGRFLWLCLISIAGACAALSVGFLLVRGHGQLDVIRAAIALGVGPVLAGAGTLTTSLLLLRGKSARRHTAAPLVVLREGWTLFASQLTAALYSASGPVILRFTVGAEAVGAYSTIERVVSAIVGACLLTHTAAYPRLAALYVSDRAAYRRLMRFVILSYMCCSLVAIASALLARVPLMRYLFGAAQPAGADALLDWGLAWLAMSIFGPALTGYLSVSGQQSRVWPLTLQALLLALILGLPGSLAFGAWAWMAALVLSQAPVLLASVRAWYTELPSREIHGL